MAVGNEAMCINIWDKHLSLMVNTSVGVTASRKLVSGKNIMMKTKINRYKMVLDSHHASIFFLYFTAINPIWKYTK